MWCGEAERILFDGGDSLRYFTFALHGYQMKYSFDISISETKQFPDIHEKGILLIIIIIVEFAISI